jgi:hypothetical protein
MLNAVKKDLFANPSVEVVDIRVQNHLPYADGYWTETVNIVVAPMKGIYEADKLQELMMQLTPSTQCTCKDDFRESETTLSFGKLYFDEDIGVEKRYLRRELIITDGDLLKKELKDFVDGKCVIEEGNDNIAIRRRTWVRLYPNVQVALKVVNEGECEYGIDKNKLSISKGRFARMLTRLGYKP